MHHQPNQKISFGMGLGAGAERVGLRAEAAPAGLDESALGSSPLLGSGAPGGMTADFAGVLLASSAARATGGAVATTAGTRALAVRVRGTVAAGRAGEPGSDGSDTARGTGTTGEADGTGLESPGGWTGCWVAGGASAGTAEVAALVWAGRV